MLTGVKLSELNKMEEQRPELQPAATPSSLSTDRLYRSCNTEDLPFSNTGELEPLG